MSAALKQQRLNKVVLTQSILDPGSISFDVSVVCDCVTVKAE